MAIAPALSLGPPRQDVKQTDAVGVTAEDGDERRAGESSL